MKLKEGLTLNYLIEEFGIVLPEEKNNVSAFIAGRHANHKHGFYYKSKIDRKENGFGASTSKYKCADDTEVKYDPLDRFNH